MPLVSVITPTQAHNADHIAAAHRSIAEAVLPAGWEWEWVVQEDGHEPALRGRLPADDRLRYGALGVQAGASATRNTALARARGEVVAGLDHDDCYLAGGLAALVGALAADEQAGWACGRCRWLLPDGGTWEKEDVLPPGRVEPGAVGAYFAATHDWPFPATFAAYRRRELVAAGGWPAIPRSEDAALLLGFSHVHAGVWLDRVVACYRRWDKQKTVRAEDLALRDLVRTMLLDRLAALEHVTARPPASAQRRTGP